MDRVGICNLALGWLSEAKIADLDGDDKPTELCNENYEIAKAAILESASWTFATKWVALAPDMEAPANPGFNKQFTIPSNVRNIRQCESAANDGSLRWVREGQKVVTEAIDTLYLRATFDVGDDELSPHACLALAHLLAAFLAVPLTQSSKLRDTHFALTQDAINKAKLLDGGQAREKYNAAQTLAARRRA